MSDERDQPDLWRRVKAIADDECVHDDADVATLHEAVEALRVLEPFAEWADWYLDANDYDEGQPLLDAVREWRHR